MSRMPVLPEFLRVRVFAEKSQKMIYAGKRGMILQ